MCNSMTPIRSREELRRRNELQMKDYLSSFNLWVTGIALGHPPTENDAFFHWYYHGGLHVFNKRWDRGEFHLK